MANDDRIDVKIGAQVGDLEVGTQAAKRMLQEYEEQFKAVQAVIAKGADGSRLIQVLKQMEAEMKAAGVNFQALKQEMAGTSEGSDLLGRRFNRLTDASSYAALGMTRLQRQIVGIGFFAVEAQVLALATAVFQWAANTETLNKETEKLAKSVVDQTEKWDSHLKKIHEVTAGIVGVYNSSLIYAQFLERNEGAAIEKEIKHLEDNNRKIAERLNYIRHSITNEQEFKRATEDAIAAILKNNMAIDEAKKKHEEWQKLQGLRATTPEDVNAKVNAQELSRERRALQEADLKSEQMMEEQGLQKHKEAQEFKKKYDKDYYEYAGLLAETMTNQQIDATIKAMNSGNIEKREAILADLNILKGMNKDRSEGEKEIALAEERIKKLAYEEEINQMQEIGKLHTSSAGERLAISVAVVQKSIQTFGMMSEEYRKAMKEMESAAVEFTNVQGKEQEKQGKQILDAAQKALHEHAKEQEQMGRQALESARKTMQLNAQAFREMAGNMHAVFDPIFSSIARGIEGLIFRTENFKEAMLNLGQAIVSNFIQIGVQLLDTLAVNALVEYITGIKMVSTNMGVGAARAAATASYLGPAAAAAAGESTAAAIGAVSLPLLSAAGGYDVPADGVVNVHKKEMILPASIADGFRDMINSGKQSPGSGSGQVHHWHINTMDAKSFHEFLKGNGSALKDEMKRQLRNFGGIS